MKHTPGPWYATVEPTAVERVNVRFYISSNNAIMIASGQSQEHLGEENGSIFEEECKANARLIAAAPELLEACQTLLWELTVMKSDARDEVIANARAAIAKAEGA